MQYIEAVSTEEPIYNKTLFLAGGITNCPDWQRVIIEGIKDLNISVFNPRRKSFDVSKPEETETQIVWEYNALRKANTVMFWFCKETLCPITLFEYGSALERSPRVLVGADPEYQRIHDIVVQTELRHPEMKVIFTLDDMIKKIRLYLS